MDSGSGGWPTRPLDQCPVLQPRGEKAARLRPAPCPTPHPAIITTPPPPAPTLSEAGFLWAIFGADVAGLRSHSRGQGWTLSQPDCPSSWGLDLGVNWLDTSSFLELWFGQAEGRKGSVALLWFWDYQGRKQERGLLARGHSGPGGGGHSAPGQWRGPSFLGILFCVLDHGYGVPALLEPGCTSKRPGQG